MNCTVSAVIHSHHQLLNGGIKASYRHLLEQPQLVDRLIVLTDEQWQDLQQEGIPGARQWRRYLSENAHKAGADIAVLEHALKLVADKR